MVKHLFGEQAKTGPIPAARPNLTHRQLLQTTDGAISGADWTRTKRPEMDCGASPAACQGEGPNDLHQMSAWNS